jgi:hypothetical protein
MSRVEVFRFSKIINAPLPFVYRWCTDFREDDYKITGSKIRRLILEKSNRRAVYITTQKGSKVGTAVGIVTLHPPNRWHFDSIGDQRNVTGKYWLKKLGPRKVKLEIEFKRTWKVSPAPPRSEFTKHLEKTWGKYISALERDYRRKLTS